MPSPSLRSFDDSWLRSSNRWRIALLLLLVAGTALRVVITTVVVDFSKPTLWEYGIIARNLSQSGVYAFHNPTVPSAFMPPAYPCIIAGLYKLFGLGIVSHIVLAVLLLCFEIAIPFLVGLVGKQLWGLRVGVLSFLLALFWPPFLSMSGRLHCIPIYTALQIAAVAAAFAGGWAWWKRGVAVGLLLGVFANFRFEASAILLIVCLTMFKLAVMSSGARTHPRTLALHTIVIPVVLFLLTLTPWLARNYAAFGVPITNTSGGFNLLRGHHPDATGTGRNPWPAGYEDGDASTKIPVPDRVRALTYDTPGDELLADALYRKQALAFIRSNPAKEALLTLRKLFYFLVSDFTHPAYRRWILWVPSLAALLIGLGFWIHNGGHDPRQQMLWMLFAVQLCVAVVFFVLPRYRISVEFVPLLFASAAVARSRLVDRLTEHLVNIPVRLLRH